MNDETRQRLDEIQRRIHEAFKASHIDPQTGAPYAQRAEDKLIEMIRRKHIENLRQIAADPRCDPLVRVEYERIVSEADTEAIAQAGITGAEAGAAFRDFINTLDASGLPPVVNQGAAPPLTIEALQQARDEVRAAYEKGRLSLGNIGIAGAINTGGAYSAAMLADQLLRERILATRGPEFVAHAEDLARTTGVSFRDAVTAIALDEMRAGFAQIGQLFGTAFADIGKARAQGVQDAIDQSDTPRNRHERRASRHKKPVRDGDQPWKPKRRRYKR